MLLLQRAAARFDSLLQRYTFRENSLGVHGLLRDSPCAYCDCACAANVSIRLFGVVHVRRDSPDPTRDTRHYRGVAGAGAGRGPGARVGRRASGVGAATIGFPDNRAPARPVRSADDLTLNT